MLSLDNGTEQILYSFIVIFYFIYFHIVKKNIQCVLVDLLPHFMQQIMEASQS